MLRGLEEVKAGQVDLMAAVNRTTEAVEQSAAKANRPTAGPSSIPQPLCLEEPFVASSVDVFQSPTISRIGNCNEPRRILVPSPPAPEEDLASLAESEEAMLVDEDVAEDFAADVTEDVAEIDLKKVFCLGGMFLPKFNLDEWNLGPHLAATLSQLIRESPNASCYLYLTMEQSETLPIVPVAVILQCDCIPTTLLAKNTVQGCEEIVSMDECNMPWAPTDHDKVFILRLEADITFFDRDQLLLYSRLPSEVNGEVVAEIDSVAIEWNDNVIVWDVGIVEDDEEADLELCCEDHDVVNADDKATVKKLLLEAKERKVVSLTQELDYIKSLYHGMMEREGMTDQALEGHKAFKVFPQDHRLDPMVVETTFGPMTTGFRKTLRVDRYIGNAERLF